MLKRYILPFLLLFSLLVLAEDVHTEQFDSLESTILKRKQKLESISSDIEILLKQNPYSIQAKVNGEIIKKLLLETFTDETYGKIISFFLNLEESILITKALKNRLFDKTLQIEVIDAVYEYPFIDEKSNLFVYISDKGTGNRNPFVLDLSSFKEKEVILPETGDYFPVLNENKMFFLTAVQEGFALKAYDLDIEKRTTLASGQINCLRLFAQNLFYSIKSKIYQIDFQGSLKETYEFQHSIQSFDIYGNYIIVSMLVDSQYDLYLYNILNRNIYKITNTPFNEMDPVFKNEESVIFSSNRKNHYGLYFLNFEEVNKTNEYHLIYALDSADIYYPHYSKNYSKIICCIYKSNKEPNFLIIEF